MKEELYTQYKNDKDYAAYVDRYCKSRNLGLFEALAHRTVSEVAEYYKTAKKDKIEPAGQQADK